MKVTDDPLVTIALPVRNGESSVERALESASRQTFGNVEIVIGNNASTDATARICRRWAARDPRVRYFEHPTAVSQIESFRSVATASRGEMIRWLGADDWIEDTYVERCVEAVRLEPRAVLVTTGQAFEEPSGSSLSEALGDRGLDRDDPVHRLDALLRLLNESYLLIDPIYSMINRRVLLASGGLREELLTDQILAAELSLYGPWVHIPAVLSHRHVPEALAVRVAAQRYGVTLSRALPYNLRMARVLARSLTEHPLDSRQRRRAHRALVHFYARRHWTTVRRRVGRLRSLTAVRYSRAEAHLG